MAKEHINQHFIPQCYLKNFSENEKFVFVYSKKNKTKGYPQSITKTASKKYFYTIPEKYLNRYFGEDIDGNIIEKNVLAEHIERLYANILTKIIQAYPIWTNRNEPQEILTTKERDLFAALIAIQYLRLPNIRDKYWSSQVKTQKIRNEIAVSAKKADTDIDFSEIMALNRDDDYASVFHSEIFLDQTILADIQDQLVKKIWIYRTTKEDAVYTSDNPILTKPHFENQTSFYKGFGMKGVEIIIPISKNILLTIWDEETFIDLKSENNKFTILTDKELRQYNCYQYIWANDEVYSSKKDFKLIELLKMANGNINEEIYKERPTIKVNGK